MPFEDSSGQDDHERRLAALRQLADQVSAAPASSAQRSGSPSPQAQAGVASAPRPHLRSRRMLPIALAVALIVAVVAGVWAVKDGLPGASRSSATTTPDMRTIDLTRFGLNCPIQPTWSPDGKRIAVLATQGDCSGGQAVPQALAVVDARTGALIRNIPLGRVLVAQGFSQGTQLSLFAWSPDSASLVFSVNYSPF